MQALYLLIPLGVVVVLGAAIALVWAIRSGQFDNLDSAAQDSLDD